MKTITAYIEDGFLEKSIAANEEISPASLKELLLKSGASSYALKNRSHETVAALMDTGAMIRKIATTLPSAGVALCMHQHVTLACARYPRLFEENERLLREVREGGALIASAFAEGIPGRDIFAPSVTVSVDGENVMVNGTKKPCTLASIADYFIISAGQVEQKNLLTLVLIPNRHPSIQTKPFWNAGLLKACDSNEVKFNELQLNRHSLTPMGIDELQGVLAYGMATFNYFAASAYCGVLDALLAKIPPRVAAENAVARAIAEYALKIDVILRQLAKLAHDADAVEDAIPSIFGLRYTLEELIENAAQYALRSCGGVTVFSSPDALILFSMVQLYKFHPASKFQFISATLQTV